VPPVRRRRRQTLRPAAAHHRAPRQPPPTNPQAHKAGRRAGLSARDKHKVAKQGGAAGLGAHKRALKRSGAAAGGGGDGGSNKKLARALASKQQRDAKKAEHLARRRGGTSAPMVVAVLPLCAQADAHAFWMGALAACQGGGAAASAAAAAAPPPTADELKRRAAAAAVGMDVEQQEQQHFASSFGAAVTCAVLAGRAAGAAAAAAAASSSAAVRFTWLAPPRDRADPLAIVDLARAADAVVLLTAAPGVAPGGRKQQQQQPGQQQQGHASDGASGDTGGVDEHGAMALAVLRAMGLPHVVAAVQQVPAACGKGRSRAAASHAGGDAMMMEDGEEGLGAGGGGAAADASTHHNNPPSMKERSAARKTAERALERHLPSAAGGGQLRLLPADTAADFAALARHLAERHPPAPPAWRQARGQVLVERVEYCAADATLMLYGYVRGGALCADQPMCVPGAGDFRVVRIEGAQAAAARGGNDPAAASVAAAVATSAPLFPVLAEAPRPSADDPPLARMNPPPDDEQDGAGGEQTWPTEAELEQAEKRRRVRRRRLPAGMSEYQAAWLLDDDEDDDDADGEDEDEDDEDGFDQDAMMDGDGKKKKSNKAAAAAAADDDDREPPLLLEDEDDDGDYGMGAAAADGEDSEDPAERAALLAQLRGASAGRATAGGMAAGGSGGAGGNGDVEAAAADDGQWPDEIELAPGVAARVRLAKYRALKSLRAGAWDPADGTPAAYARVFAFENAQRAAKRARVAAQAALAAAVQEKQQQQKQQQQQQQQRAAAAMDDEAMAAPALSVAPGTYVRVALAAVPEAAAARLAQRAQAALCGGGGSGLGGGGAPPVAFGLLEHESKLSVLNLALRRSLLPQRPTAAQARAGQPLANKHPLLFVVGGRAFVARPIFSDDHHGAELHRMARYLRCGESAVATVYGPISHGPLPVLAFKLPDGHPLLGLQGGAAALAEAASAGPSPASTSTDPPALVATGALRSVDPDRVVLKRAVLTGYPVRTHKSKAVVRFMFGHPDDVRWFQPAELWTRGGRRGRITEPLGTHGAFKARFDGPVPQRDAVCISLYKRVFPKWPVVSVAAAAGGDGGSVAAGAPGTGEGFEAEEAVVGRDGERFAVR
jgi:pre-rRNA-processing protein TSR1